MRWTVADLRANRDYWVEVLRDTCRKEMDRYGLEDWKLLLSDGVSLLGDCNTKGSTIRVNLKLAGVPSQVRETILHEIAHALVDMSFICAGIINTLSGGKYSHLMNRRTGHHDGWWQYTALLIGCSPKATANYSVRQKVDDTEAL